MVKKHFLHQISECVLVGIKPGAWGAVNLPPVLPRLWL